MKPLCSEISPPEEKNKNRPYTSSSGSCSGSRGGSSGSGSGSSSGSRSSTSREGGERGEGKEGGVSLSLISLI